MNNHKIVFVNPPYERIAAGYDFVKHITNKSPSLGLLYLAAIARDKGYQTSLIESDIENLNTHQVAERLITENPTYIGITLFTVGVWQAAEIARIVKQQCPNIIIIVGGPHISSMGLETLQRFKAFDYAVVNEGEAVLPALLTAIEQNDNLDTVNGIIHKVNNIAIQTPPAPTINDLDSLPFPAWDLLPNFPNTYLPAIYDYPQGPVATMVASRGCPFLCKFCDTSTFGARVRAYTPQTVFNMMKHLKQQYGIKHIQFVDDLFLASKVRALELCDLLIDNKLNMSWSCTARVDTVKPNVLKRMKQAGCWEISFGLETGSNELLQKMEKAARVELSEQAVNWTSDAGIRSKGLFMLGYPGETIESIKLTKDFVRRLPMTTMNLSKFTPYPGSPIYKEIYGTNIKEEHWEKMNGMNFVWNPEGLSTQLLDQEYQNILLSFYKQHKIMRKYVTMSLQNPQHLIRFFRFISGYLVAKASSHFNGAKGILTENTETTL